MMLGGFILEDLRRTMSEAVEEAFDELTENMRRSNLRSAILEQEARQPSLATEADVPHDTKTRNHIEDVSAERVIGGDNSSVQVDTDTVCRTSFGDDSTKLQALPCSKDGATVDKGAAAPKPCLSPTEISTRIATGGLLSADTASTAMRTIFSRPSHS